jgi:hypothetical protein
MHSTDTAGGVVRRRGWSTLAAVLVATALVTVAHVEPAGAAPIACSTSALAAAITQADNSSSPTTITLPSRCQLTFVASDNNTDGGNALPVITKPMTIVGSGSTIAFHLQHPEATPRAFEIWPGASLTMSDLTITGFKQGNGVETFGGGAIYNRGTTVLNRVLLLSNTTDGNGGAIRNNGTLTINDSTIVGNKAYKLGSSSTGLGGAISNGGGSVTIRRSTIINNEAQVNGAGLFDYAKTTVGGSIISGNVIHPNGRDPSGTSTSNDCSQRVTDGGYNLVGDNTCGFATGATSKASQGTGLVGPLAANGGDSLTAALPLTVNGLANPARDAIPAGDVNCPSTGAADQRGLTRPQLGKCDVGAFEPGPVNVSLAYSADPQAGKPITVSATLSGAGVPRLPVPTGSVKFFKGFSDDGTPGYGTAVLNASGVASVTIPSLPRGMNVVSATFLGSSVYWPGKTAYVVVPVSVSRHFAGYTSLQPSGGWVASTLLTVPTVDCSATPNRTLFVGLSADNSGRSVATQPSAVTAVRAGVRVTCNALGAASYATEAFVGDAPQSAASAAGQSLFVSLAEASGNVVARVRNLTKATSIFDDRALGKTDTLVYLGVSNGPADGMLAKFSLPVFRDCVLNGDFCSGQVTGSVRMWQEGSNVVQAIEGVGADATGRHLTTAVWQAAGDATSAPPATPAAPPAGTATPASTTGTPSTEQNFAGHRRLVSGTWTANATFVVPTVGCSNAPGSQTFFGIMGSLLNIFGDALQTHNTTLSVQCPFGQSADYGFGGLSVVAGDTVFVGVIRRGGTLTSTYRNVTRHTVSRVSSSVEAEYAAWFGVGKRSTSSLVQFSSFTMRNAQYNGDWLGAVAGTTSLYNMAGDLGNATAGAISFPASNFVVTYQS